MAPIRRQVVATRVISGCLYYLVRLIAGIWLLHIAVECDLAATKTGNDLMTIKGKNGIVFWSYFVTVVISLVIDSTTETARVPPFWYIFS